MRTILIAALLFLVGNLASPLPAQSAPQGPAAAPPTLSPEAMRRQEQITVAMFEERLRFERAKNDRLIREDDHVLFTYWKQSVTDIVLTIFVIIIVGIGVYLSYLQFRADNMASLSRKRRVDEENHSDPRSTRTDLKVSKEGVELSSSVIGLFILLASMFFFYLYIEKVYPVRINAAPPPAAALSAK